MPIYEYQCKACGNHHEALQKVSDPELTVCPHCHQPSLARQISLTSFRLKGSGWYETDFKDKPKADKVSDSKSSSTDKTTEKNKSESTAKPKTTRSEDKS